MKMLKSGILCFAVVPALLLVLYMVEQYGASVQSRPDTLQPAVIGFVDKAGDFQGADTLPASGKLYISGWAADTRKGTPVDRVTVYVDGVNVGTARLGLVRKDVPRYYRRSDFATSGWSLEMSASKLGPGLHTVTATASSMSGTAELPSNRNFTIR